MKYWISLLVLMSLAFADELKGYVFSKIVRNGQIFSAPVNYVYVGVGMDSTRSQMDGSYTLIYIPESSSSGNVSSSSSDLTAIKNSLFHLSLKSAYFDASGQERRVDMQGKIKLYNKESPLLIQRKVEAESRLVPQGVLFLSDLYFPKIVELNSLTDTIWLQWDSNSVYAQINQAFYNFDSLRIYSWEKSQGSNLRHLDTNGLGSLLGQSYHLIGDTAVMYYFTQENMIVDSMLLHINLHNSDFINQNYSTFPEQLFDRMAENEPIYQPVIDQAVRRSELQRTRALFETKFKTCIAEHDFQYLCDPSRFGLVFYHNSQYYHSYLDGDETTNQRTLHYVLKRVVGDCMMNDELTVQYTLDPIAKTLKDTMIYKVSPECLAEIHF